jgi:dihydrolipoamide dehydrogenase
MGIEIHGEPTVNLKRMGERRDKVVRNQRTGIESLLRSDGVTLLRGKGKLLDRRTVMVEKRDGNEMISADKILLATGSRPRPLPHIPFDGEVVVSSDEAVQLKEIPETLLIVGAGSVGAEFAFIYAGLGSHVTVVEMLDRALPLEDNDVSEIIAREMKKWGIELVTKTKVEALLKKKVGATVVLDGSQEVTANKVLLSVGRSYNTEGLQLDAAGVQVRADNAIKVNERLQTNVSNIYAAGDCTGGRLLAHVASREAVVAIENCAGITRNIDYRVIPSCTFTAPEVASVGLTEEQARESGNEIRVGRFDFRNLGKAHADGEIVGMVKIVADSETGRILGGHIVGHEASTLIHEIAAAMSAGMTAGQLAETVHAHPTLSEAVMEAAADVTGSSIHKPRSS